MITVVSGLPRSGTSLMMQMLGAAGMPLLTDSIRVADADNERGYFEYEPVKAMERDASWIPQAEGRAIKIVSLLLYHLPPGPEYRVLFMRRPLPAVLRSQAEMLRRRGEPAPGPEADRLLAVHFERHLQAVGDWLARMPNVRVLDITYETLVQSPRTALAAVPGFLGRELDLDRMAGTVDPSLRHH